MNINEMLDWGATLEDILQEKGIDPEELEEA